MKKIAIITPGVLPIPAIKGGAVESLINEYIDYNDKTKLFHLTVFSIFDKKIKKQESESTNFVYIKNNAVLSFFDKLLSNFQKLFLKKKNATTFKNLFNRYNYYLGVRRYLKNNDFDLIVLENHCAEYLCLKSKLLQKKYYKKVIFHSHNIPAHFKPFIKWMACTKSIYSVSQSLSSLWKSALENYNLNIDFLVIRNGVDTNLFRPIYDINGLKAYKNEFSIDLRKKIILYAGRITKSKGVLHVIDSVRNLTDDYHLLIVGDYFYGINVKNQESKEIAKALKSIDGRYSFTGFVNRELMPIIYNLADIIVLPSIEYDAAPLTLIESICCCKPVISTKIGGIPEYSTNAGVVLLEINNSLSLDMSKMIEQLTSDTASYNDLVNKSKEQRLDYSLELFLKRYDKIIIESVE